MIEGSGCMDHAVASSSSPVTGEPQIQPNIDKVKTANKLKRASIAEVLDKLEVMMSKFGELKKHMDSRKEGAAATAYHCSHSHQSTVPPNEREGSMHRFGSQKKPHEEGSYHPLISSEGTVKCRLRSTNVSSI